MKIALLLTGQLRTVDVCKHILKYALIDKYDVDVYMAIDTSNDIQDVYRNSIGKTSAGAIAEAVQFFQPVDLFVSSVYDYKDEIDAGTQVLLKSYIAERYLQLILRQYYFVHKCYQMMKSSGRCYDHIMRVRFDQFLWTDKTALAFETMKCTSGDIAKQNIDITKLIDVVKPLTFELDQATARTIRVLGLGQVHGYSYVNDQFLSHGSDINEVMSQFYSEIPKILVECTKTFFPNRGCVIEHVLHNFLCKYYVKVEKSVFNGVFVREV